MRPGAVHEELSRLGRRLAERLVGCPEDGRLRLYALGELAESDRLTTLLHLDQCPDCRRRLQELEVRPDWSQPLAALHRRRAREARPTAALLRRLRSMVDGLADLWPEAGYRPIPVAATRSGDSGRAAFQEAMRPYEAGEPVRAAEALEGYLDAHPEDHEAHFYAGATYLRQDQGALALELLGQALELAGDEPPPRYRWSYVKALLLSGRTDQARSLLAGLAREGDDWARRAGVVLHRLEQAT